EVMYAITETVRKTARQITWRGMYQRLLKVDPLKCILCGSRMRFTGLKRGYRLAELAGMHEPLARQRVCG
ncbi:TPA: IS91 family transposase, partial [Escherichia coli]|nr:IS91 family transposase [Escherichia coli]